MIALPSTHQYCRTALARQRGFNLVELMISIAVGLILLAGLSMLFVNSSRTSTNVELATQQSENGRYAMQVIANDLHNAGHLATFDPTTLATPTTKPDACATDLASLTAALPISVQGYDNGASAPSCISDVRANTDILVVRLANTCAIGDAGCDAVIAGAPYLQTSGCSGSAELGSGVVTSYFKLDTATANLTLHQKDCTTVAPYQQYLVHIFFIANNDKAGDGIPTLKRAELGAGSFSIVPIAEGVQDLQLEYGVDTASPTTGSVSVFTSDPDSYNSCAGVTCVGYWRNTVAVRVNLLTVANSAMSGYTDTKTYVLGLNADGSQHTVGPFNDGFMRHVFTSTVSLFNVIGRNMP
jgi:type IV pilus assembly protein PilW